MGRVRIRPSLLTALAAALLAGGCGGSGPKGSIVFAGVVDGSRGIYTVAVDGSRVRRLAHGGAQLSSPHDDARLAFVRDGDIWVMSRSGAGARRIVRGPVYEYAWSPDGKQIAYRGDDLRLFVVTLGGAVRPLVDNGRSPVWSPDGRWVAYLTSVAHANDQVEKEYVAIVRPDGTGRQRLQVGLATGVAWSPDARRLAFAAPAEGVDDGRTVSLYTMLADGTHLLAVVPRARFDLHTVNWSPSGKLIAFADGGGTWVAAASGKTARRVSRLEYEAWSPDGRWLVARDARHLQIVSPAGAPMRDVVAATAVDSVVWLR